MLWYVINNRITIAKATEVNFFSQRKSIKLIGHVDANVSLSFEYEALALKHFFEEKWKIYRKVENSFGKSHLHESEKWEFSSRTISLKFKYKKFISFLSIHILVKMFLSRRSITHFVHLSLKRYLIPINKSSFKFK